ncbi:hypothetical protein NECID01_0781 [Nematocida sp. AWRm77]|nr:hypothetical protein NECID01_0781 [Nematocida sp. AWRm77]
MNKVQALIRIKPLSKEEKRKGAKQGWTKVGERGIIQHLNTEGHEVSAQAAFFDWVFSETETNREVFSHVAPSFEQALAGINTCVIAYGQTASGKTYTMRGKINEEHRKGPKKTKVFAEPGIIPLGLEYLLGRKTTHVFAISFIEVYNENVYDLLGDPAESLQIRELPSGETYIKDATETEVCTEEEAFQVFLKGDRARKICATQMNRESSRSHAVLKVRIRNNGVWSVSMFVDLAGSERVGLTHTSGASLKEGGHINKSLLALTSVISKLSKKYPHIPYRDAKLTRILQPSLSGASLTTIICTVSPSPLCAEETASTLSLASRAKNIEIKLLAKAPKRKESSVPQKFVQFAEDTLKELKQAQAGIGEVKLLLARAEREIQECVSSPLALQGTELGSILKELKHTKSMHLAKLAELSESVQYLLQQEKHLSKAIHPPPDISTLLQHLVEGDKLIQQQREQIKALLSSAQAQAPRHAPIDSTSISMALEISRAKKEFQREKRILELRIAQLESQTSRS